MASESYSIDPCSADDASAGKISPVIGRFAQSLARRALLWFSRQMRIRRDTAIVKAMNDRELKDLGFGGGDASHEGVEPQSWRREENFILLDGLPFSGNSRKTLI